ncbi:MAG: hypothetical protein CMF52_07360 [Legionellales bacterium]|nr:hypothetical protein [Legionellales bacterium]
MGASFFIRLFKYINLFIGDGIDMAYNVLKGKVEGSVDQYGDQEIEGKKVFKNTISASVFYDTDAQSPCATIKDLAVKKINGKMKGGVLTYDTDGAIKTNSNLMYDGECLRANIVKAKLVVGSAIHMSDIPANKFHEKVNAESLNFSHGLHSVRKELQVKAINGLVSDTNGVGISLSSNSGLSVKSKNLVIDPTRAESINAAGQNLSDQDLLIVSDISRGTLNNTTLKNLYDGYIKHKAHKPAGKKSEIQLMGVNQFASSPNLTFDAENNTLAVNGIIGANNVTVDSSLSCRGSVSHNINKISESRYTVQPSDYTILCDASNNKITVNLPPAVNNSGRVLIIKKTNTDKYKLNSNQIEVTCEEGTIDINDTISIKMNYSSRTLQSDGENWWIIGTKGS